MFTLFQASLDNLETSMLVLPTTMLTEPNQKRWHMAFAAVYCSRAFSTPLKKSRKKSPVSSNRVVIDVFEPHSCFPKIDQSVLAGIVKQKNLDQLRKYDGVEGLACGLKTNLENGISGDGEDVLRRSEAFGSNTYRRPPTKSLWYFVWEALRDPTILILLVCAALSLGFGIKEHGLKDGWYDGGSIFVAVFLVIAVSALSNFRQNRQFVKLSKVSNNIQVDVVRNGRRQQVSIFEIVVGDVVCLKIGDQVPADGLFIDGHSLLVDESSMTGVEVSNVRVVSCRVIQLPCQPCFVSCRAVPVYLNRVVPCRAISCHSQSCRVVPCPFT